MSYIVEHLTKAAQVLLKLDIESIEQMTEISITEKIYLNNKMNNKKFKETVASRMVIKSLCPLLKLNYFGIHNNNSGKPILIKNNVMRNYSN